MFDARSRQSLSHMELDSVDEGVVVYRPSVSGPSPQRLPISLT